LRHPITSSAIIWSRGLTKAQDVATLSFLGSYGRVASHPMLKKDDEDFEFLILHSRLALGQVDAVLTATKSASNPTQKGNQL
jgi:hypothetical protein